MNVPQALPSSRASTRFAYCLSLVLLGCCGEHQASEATTQQATSELMLIRPCWGIAPICLPATTSNGCSQRVVCANGSWRCQSYGSVPCGQGCGEGFSAACDSWGQVGSCMRSCGSQCGGGYSQTCTPDGTAAPTPCQPTNASTETCNGCDDDRDGKVDNAGALPLSESCAVGQCQTQKVCVSGSWSDCGNEFCNGLDDNCDGRIDENDVCKSNDGRGCCIPLICTPSMAGSHDDQCGGSINCGPLCFPSCNGRCGNVSDGCGGTMTCRCKFPARCFRGTCQ